MTQRTNPKRKRPVNNIVVHCTGTKASASVESIRSYHKNSLGWKNPGYHFIIKANGEIVQLLDIEKIANGVKGHNSDAIHIAYIGGISKTGRSVDTRTPAQIESLFNLIIEFAVRYPKAKILGHRDFKGVSKTCPNFDVKSWLSSYIPNIEK